MKVEKDVADIGVLGDSGVELGSGEYGAGLSRENRCDETLVPPGELGTGALGRPWFDKGWKLLLRRSLMLEVGRGASICGGAKLDSMFECERACI